MKFLEQQRIREGKEDGTKLLRDKIRGKIQEAIEKNKKIEKEDRIGEVKTFLQEVLECQDRIKEVEESIGIKDENEREKIAIP